MFHAVLKINLYDLILWWWQADQAPSYKTFFMLNSTEHEISIAHKNYNTDK